MTVHHRLLCQDRLRCACGWSVPWPAADRWGEIWDAHIRAVESAQPQGAPAGAVTSGSGGVPPAPVAYRHGENHTYRGGYIGRCTCGWEGQHSSDFAIARREWLEHAVAAYQQEDAVRNTSGGTLILTRAQADYLATNHDTDCVCVLCGFLHCSLPGYAADDDEADCDALAGDDVAGSEVREESRS